MFVTRKGDYSRKSASFSEVIAVGNNYVALLMITEALAIFLDTQIDDL